MSDVRQAVEALLASRTKTGSRPTELDVLIAIAALEADEPAVLALLAAEATRRKRPGPRRQLQPHLVVPEPMTRLLPQRGFMAASFMRRVGSERVECP